MFRHYSERVAPVGNPRINVCLPLPGAYRSLPRPSSPASAKAFIVRPFTLDQKIFSGLLGTKLLARLFAVVKEQRDL